MSRPTMETVAERAGVSRALVSLVMNNSPKVSDTKRQAVLEAAAELGYRPNLHARSLAQQRTKTLGMIINDIHNPFFAEVVYGVEAAAEEHGFEVLILNGGRDADRERRAVETHLQFQVEALILVGPKLDDDDITGVGGGTDRGGGVRRDNPGADTITTDEERARSRSSTSSNSATPTSSTSTALPTSPHAPGRAAMRRPCARSGSSRESCEAATTKPTPRPQSSTSPRPIRCPPPFSPSTTSSPPALSTLEAAGLRVPDDVSVVGYDNTFIAELNHMSLTTVNQPRHQMGQLAIRTVLERIEDDRTEPPVSTSHRPCRCGGRRRRPKGLT